MINIFFDDLDVLYHLAKFGKIVLRAGAVGAKMVFVFVFCFLFLGEGSPSESGALCLRVVHNLNKHCVAVYRPISTMFSASFSEWIALSVALHSSHFRNNFREISVKNCKKSKNRRKSLCAPLRIDR